MMKKICLYYIKKYFLFYIVNCILILQVINGRGIDRHLLGLKLTAIESGEAIPELFKDPAFSESCHWRLSTSQVKDEWMFPF